MQWSKREILERKISLGIISECSDCGLLPDSLRTLELSEPRGLKKFNTMKGGIDCLLVNVYLLK